MISSQLIQDVTEPTTLHGHNGAGLDLHSRTATTPGIVWQARPQGSTDLVWRFDRNPILGRHAIPCAQAIFNSSVALLPDGRYVGVFRADHLNGMPDLHIGWSADGITWDISNDAIQFAPDNLDLPRHDYAYDPRITPIGNRYYLAWCAGYHGPTIGLCWTEDFETFHRHDNALLPCNRNGVLFPRLINGKYAMLNRPSDQGHTPFGEIFYSESPDLTHWGHHRHVMASGILWWESTKIGSGAVPIETPEGWLLFYHGVRNSCNGFVYSMGMALLDLDQPWKVRCRLPHPLLMPEEDYETVGSVPNVVFPCAAVEEKESGKLAIYYGAADTHLALAFAYRDELVQELLKYPV